MPTFGTVRGQFVLDVIDGPDADSAPDLVTATGTVSFRASVGALGNVGNTPNPVSVIRSVITGVLDPQGYLCTPLSDGATPGARGVQLLATDDPENAPAGWVWTVDYNLYSPDGTRLDEPKSHDIALPAGAEVWLTTVIPSEAAQGAIPLPQAEALAAAALGAAIAAREAAQDAEESAEESAASAWKAAQDLAVIKQELAEHYVRTDQVMIGIDTDGVPYFGHNIPFENAVPLLTDEDGVPYLML
ncbi:hypothetical protein B0I08_101321 [Glaciihabitans tibetensis]|uniref:Uncharacterized protein n=1 Tax=Glaciihabitans tibetensis TaxID=1266600 RepID=A0A2T0VJ08_9MICO|nr:hypothetical protein [Glaciihabitans tibetensis]PRY70193.1 hypothetical protein B0I08_101321 [Glaciihabitans tibetensis]